MFPEELAINGKWCFAPAHYMKTILPEFIGQDAAEKKAKEMGFSDAKKMGKETGYYFWNVSGIPTLNPYVLSTEPGKNDTNGTYWEFVRNPYYWKVDQEGKQLPYVDSIQWTKISDDSQSLIKILAGEVDFATAGWADIETLSANANKVGYKIYQWATSGWSDTASQVELNQTAPNLSERKLFQEKDFRQALSISVNRSEFAKNISGGWSEPGQAAPWRYSMLREKTKKVYPLINFLGIHLFPTIVVYLCILPAVAAVQAHAQFRPLCAVFLLLSVTATVCQGIADTQMHIFRSKGTGGFIRTGLWKHSRHPNYACEILMWWGIALASISAMPDKWFLCAGAAVNTIMFFSVSIPMADKRQSRKPGFEEYKKATRML